MKRHRRKGENAAKGKEKKKFSTKFTGKQQLEDVSMIYSEKKQKKKHEVRML